MKYDPRVAHYERMNDSQIRGIARRDNHRFKSDFGGCSANYRN